MCVWSQNEIISPRRKTQEELISNREIAIVHSEYNRHDIQRKKIREILNETMGLLGKNTNEGGLGIK